MMKNQKSGRGGGGVRCGGGIEVSGMCLIPGHIPGIARHGIKVIGPMSGKHDSGRALTQCFCES